MITEKDIQRFWSHVDKTDGCWKWTARVDKNGYGKIKVSRKMCRTHRFSWTVAFGEIPSGMFVCHKCDVPSCVNPDHLFLGTALDNNRDMMQKGRQRLVGPAHPATGDRNGSRLYPERLPRGSDWVSVHSHERRDGEHNGNAKLTREQVEEIRALRANGARLKALSAKFGISVHHVVNISKGRSWT